MSGSKTRRAAWLKRKRRVGKRLHGTAEKPRLTVFRSHRFIYAQLVDDDQGKTLFMCDTTAKQTKVIVPCRKIQCIQGANKLNQDKSVSMAPKMFAAFEVSLFSC